MKITFSDILNSGYWEQYCEAQGYNEYFLREGRASSDEEAPMDDVPPELFKKIVMAIVV